MAFDLQIADGIDMRSSPLNQRKAMLTGIREGAEDRIALTNGVVGEGCAQCRAVVDADLEGIVAKLLADAYRRGRADLSTRIR